MQLTFNDVGYIHGFGLTQMAGVKVVAQNHGSVVKCLWLRSWVQFWSVCFRLWATLTKRNHLLMPFFRNSISIRKKNNKKKNKPEGWLSERGEREAHCLGKCLHPVWTKMCQTWLFQTWPRWILWSTEDCYGFGYQNLWLYLRKFLDLLPLHFQASGSPAKQKVNLKSQAVRINLAIKILI